MNLKMKSNPSTGFSWIVDMPKSSECIKEVEREYVHGGDKGKIGAGGTEILKFKAIGSGCLENIRIAYGRSWAFDWNKLEGVDVRKLKINVSGPPKEVKDNNLLVFKMHEVNKGANGKKSVQVPQGKKIGLWARANPTTGFQWLVNVAGGKCVKKVDQKYRMDDRGYPKAGQPALMGVGGATTIVFEPVGEPGCKETVQLAYYQPWNFPGFA